MTPAEKATQVLHDYEGKRLDRTAALAALLELGASEGEAEEMLAISDGATDVPPVETEAP